MAAWLEKLLAGWSKPAQLVVIGAGDLALWPLLRACGAQQLLLVEGDPQAAERLQAALAGWPAASLRAQALSPDGATLRWRQYDQPRFNGPLSPSALRQHYPRLRETGQRELPGQTLADCLRELPAATGSSLLLINLPGQEDALLASCPAELLQRFDGIALRGCAEPLWDGATVVDQASGRLAKLGFKAHLVDRQSEPLWPLVELRLDRVKLELGQLRAQLQAQGAELAAARASQQAEREQAAAALAACRDELAQQTALAQSQREQVQAQLQARDAAEQAAAQARAELQALREARAVTEQLAQEHWHSVELLTLERDALLRRQQQLDEQIQQGAAAQQRLSESLDALRAELQAALAERDAQAALAAERAAEIAAQAEQVEQLQRRADEAWQRLEQMNQELALAEGQLEMLKDLLLDEPTL